MSRKNYIRSQELAQEPFEALVMAFMRIADGENVHMLKSRYPLIWDELYERYNAPGGYLKEEHQGEISKECQCRACIDERAGIQHNVLCRREE